MQQNHVHLNLSYRSLDLTKTVKNSITNRVVDEWNMLGGLVKVKVKLRTYAIDECDLRAHL